MDKTYRVEMINGGKCCLTCEHWGGKREKKAGSFSEAVQCEERFTSGECKKHLGSYRMASYCACADYSKWHELK